MNVKKFETPEIDIIFLGLEDIITTSATGETDPDLDDVNESRPENHLPIG